MDHPSKIDRYRAEISTTEGFREEIPNIVDKLVQSCNHRDCFDRVGPEPISSQDSIVAIIQRGRDILYPLGKVKRISCEIRNVIRPLEMT